MKILGLINLSSNLLIIFSLQAFIILLSLVSDIAEYLQIQKILTYDFPYETMYAATIVRQSIISLIQTFTFILATGYFIYWTYYIPKLSDSAQSIKKI